MKTLAAILFTCAVILSACSNPITDFSSPCYIVNKAPNPISVRVDNATYNTIEDFIMIDLQPEHHSFSYSNKGISFISHPDTIYCLVWDHDHWELIKE